MSDQGQIPLQEITLPVTGAVVKLANFLTIGQSRELQKAIFKGGNYNIDSGKIENLPVDAFLDMQDKAAEFLIKEIIDSSGNKIEYSKDWLYNLPVKDGTFIYEKVNNLTNEATLSAEDKKK